jgi:hypothetical protein
MRPCATISRRYTIALEIDLVPAPAGNVESFERLSTWIVSPVIQRAGHACVLSEPAVSETNPASLHELLCGSDVRVSARGLLDRLESRV